MAQKGLLVTRAAAITTPEDPRKLKVTLTNWKRVANSPFEIPAGGPVQAVHWGDYIVLFDVRKKEMHLYHHKCGMWSAVYTCSNDLRNASVFVGCSMPVAVLKQDLLLLSNRGDMYKFKVEIGHWKMDNFLRIQDDILGDEFSKLGSGRQISCSNVVLVSTFDQQSLIALLQKSIASNGSEHLYLKQFRDSDWSGAREIQRAFLPNKSTRVSYALSGSNLYVNTIASIYCIDINDKGEKITVTEICLPSLNRFTICSANDTMFSFGGMDEDGQPSSDVNRYNASTNEWEPAGYMRSCRYSVIASSFQKDEDNVDIIVVGGVLGEIQQPQATLVCRIAEICEVGTSVR
jgi:hypothetical protein